MTGSRNILLLIVAGVIMLALSVGSQPPERISNDSDKVLPDDSVCVPLEIHEPADIALVQLHKEDWLSYEKHDWSRGARDFSLDAVSSDVAPLDMAGDLKKGKSSRNEAERKSDNDYSKFLQGGNDHAGFEIQDKDWLTHDMMDLERRTGNAGESGETTGTKNRSLEKDILGLGDSKDSDTFKTRKR